jgi:hypothetical protein
MLLAKLRETYHRQLHRPILITEFRRGVGVFIDSGRESVELLKDVKVSQTGPTPDQSADAAVARSQSAEKIEEIALRLDDNALPAAFVEPERNVIGDRVSAADIDIRTGTLAREGEPQMIVFHVLRVGEVHRHFLNPDCPRLIYQPRKFAARQIMGCRHDLLRRRCDQLHSK